MDFFSEDAFDNRREFIVDFYRGQRENVERVYDYLTEKEMDRFVEECAERIYRTLMDEYL